MKEWKACLQSLKTLLAERKDLKKALRTSIEQAGVDEVQNLKDYYKFLEGLLIQVPVHRTMGLLTDKFHYLIAHSPNNLLKTDPAFRRWLVSFSHSHGSYLDTTDSAKSLRTFTEDPAYKIEQYNPPPGGWLTFNQFFTRHIKPGMRPVAALHNQDIVVAATDSVYKGWWPIDADSFVMAKGNKYAIADLLEGSPYQHSFSNGVFTHSYLDTTDYHRFHVPLAGTLREARKIPGDVIVNTSKEANGEYLTEVEVGFQFTQTRALVVLETALGLVALLPIGMGHVSSVTITAANNATLHKGEEFGYFAYGGSDFVMLFQENKVIFTATPEKHYQQGEEIARAIR